MVLSQLNVIHLCVPDAVVGSERCDPAGHHTHRGQPESEAGKRRAPAGLRSGGKHLFSQVN